ncbi:MAG: NYN domain-containing protein [Candidatus Hydrogenedentes bacterium]|nr:NYN domain-containing protein [Candidatus Hydrogenedentota bacterium]
MRRVHLYIDGFNLYHALMNAPSLRGYRWLNFRRLGESIISSKEQLAAIYYFTAFYPGDAAKTARHKTFIQAQSLVGVQTILGEFRRKDKYCRACRQTSPGYEEKETDVNIAVQILVDAALNLMDKCIVLSNDSDLLPVIRALKKTYPQIAVKLVFPPNQASKALKAEVPDYMRLKERHLAANQFPDPLLVGKASILKPPGW